MSGSALQKAQLVPIDPSSQQALTDKAIPVHFNPETLKLSYTVTVKADTASKNSSDQSAQQSSNNSAKLAVDLIFDTTDLFEQRQDEADVRKVVTRKIVDTFVAPPPPTDGAANGKPIPANPCLFLWGTFQFTGLVDSYNETLEFFSASGVPLRAAVAISLTENRYNITNIPQRVPGQAQPVPPGGQIGSALSASGGTGFSVGSSASLGTGIAGAFSARSGAAATASAGFGASASAGFGFG
jgi:hypothetical protein